VRPLHDTLVSTDPPYYDNIGYADLSDYFYVWLRRALKDVLPDLFSTLLTPKREELIASHYRHGGRKEADMFFEEGLFGTFARMRDAQHPDFPLTLFYAFKQAETQSDGAVASTGWDTMLSALLNAGLTITGTWPVRTERSARSIAIGSAALASSIVLVCRPRPDDAPLATRRELVGALRGELPEALRTLQQGNVAPVDLAQAAIGPGMAVFSRYAKVVEADGSAMTVRTALGLINQALDEILAEQEGDFDADTRFAITWFEQYGMDEADFGQADVLARAKNTSVGGWSKRGCSRSAARRLGCCAATSSQPTGTRRETRA
jgi:putative DNA methylase